MRIAALVLCIACAGCGATFADPMGRENELETTQRRYTRLVRWGEIERASEFVDPALREDFLVHGPRLERIRITDFEIGKLDFDEDDDDQATVTVTYRAYSLSTASERAITERQHWFREPGLSNTWHVRSELPDLLSRFEAGQEP